MKKLILFSTALFLIACGNVSGSEKNAEQMASFIKEELSIEEEVVVVQEEYLKEVLDVYDIGDYITVIPNSEDGVRQINFSNVDEENLNEILEVFDFPKTNSMERLIEHYYNQLATQGKADPEDIFTSYEGVGASMTVKLDIFYDLMGDKPFMLSFVYDEERIEEMKKEN